MMWEWEEENDEEFKERSSRKPEQPNSSYLNFDFFSSLSNPKDYYKILEVDYDATDDAIRSNYIRLALKWHPDKQKNQEDAATSRFQQINEAYQDKLATFAWITTMGSEELLNMNLVLSDPVKRKEYDKNGMQYVYDYNIIDYLNRYKGLILTCNGLGLKHSIW